MKFAAATTTAVLVLVILLQLYPVAESWFEYVACSAKVALGFGCEVPVP